MAHFGSIAIPRTAIVPLAMAASRRAKIVAIVTAVACLTCLGFGIADVIEGSGPDRDDVAAAFWVGLFALVCVLAVLRARRTAAAARRAAASEHSRWTLLGKLVVASDEYGQPVPEHSFTITRGQARRIAV